MVGLLASPFYLFRAARMYYKKPDDEVVEMQFGELFEGLSRETFP